MSITFRIPWNPCDIHLNTYFSLFEYFVTRRNIYEPDRGELLLYGESVYQCKATKLGQRETENKIETEKKKTYFTIYDDSLGHFSQTFRRLLVLLLFFEKTAYTIKQYSRNS